VARRVGERVSTRQIVALAATQHEPGVKIERESAWGADGDILNTKA
jgi:hypothetical protein